jgi:hypothetical protein
LDSFLADFDDRLPWKKTSGALKATEILRGSDGTGLTVVLAEASSEPSKVDLQGLWRMRAGRSADPVLVLTTYPSEDGERVAASDSLRGSHPDHPGACGFLARHPPFGHGATSPERKSEGYPNPGSASPMHRLTPPI